MRLSVAASVAGFAVAVLVVVPAQAEMTEAGRKAMVSAGKIMFEHRCRSCHADDPAANSYGPPLMGVIGRKAGTVEGFEYSDAMKSSGIVWNEATLRAWIADNTAFMPGTRMRHVAIDDAAEQDFLIAFIQSLQLPLSPEESRLPGRYRCLVPCGRWAALQLGFRFLYWQGSGAKPARSLRIPKAAVAGFAHIERKAEGLSSRSTKPPIPPRPARGPTVFRGRGRLCRCGRISAGRPPAG